MHVRIVQPAESLRGMISSYYVLDIDSPEALIDHTVPEWGNIRIIESGGWSFRGVGDSEDIAGVSMIQGPTTRPYRFALQKCRVFGIGLLPEAFARFWGADVGKLADAWVPLAEIMGPSGTKLAADLKATPGDEAKFAIANTYFKRLIENRQTSYQDLLARRVQQLLNDPQVTQVEDLSDALQMAPSSVARACRQRFGYAPKKLLRRQRFLRMLAALHARPYSEWPDFVDPQYADQSHMIRDFKYFMGMSPGQYMALPRPIQQSSAAHRIQALGKPLQGLE
jgi:AraC-like DNA-binding protein